MSGNDELCVLVLPQHVVEQNEKSQLSLGRKRRLGLVQQKQPVALELEFEECEERLAVRTSMEALVSVEFIEAVLVNEGGSVKKTLCP